MRAESHVGDVEVFTFTIYDEHAQPLDVSTAGQLQITLQRPDGSNLSPKSATKVTDGTDGQIKITILTADFDMPGEWKAQVKIVAGPYTNYTTIIPFTVEGNL